MNSAGQLHVKLDFKETADGLQLQIRDEDGIESITLIKAEKARPDKPE